MSSVESSSQNDSEATHSTSDVESQRFYNPIYVILGSFYYIDFLKERKRQLDPLAILFIFLGLFGSVILAIVTDHAGGWFKAGIVLFIIGSLGTIAFSNLPSVFPLSYTLFDKSNSESFISKYYTLAEIQAMAEFMACVINGTIRFQEKIECRVFDLVANYLKQCKRLSENCDTALGQTKSPYITSSSIIKIKKFKTQSNIMLHSRAKITEELSKIRILVNEQWNYKNLYRNFMQYLLDNPGLLTQEQETSLGQLQYFYFGENLEVEKTKMVDYTRYLNQSFNNYF